MNPNIPDRTIQKGCATCAFGGYDYDQGFPDPQPGAGYLCKRDCFPDPVGVEVDNCDTWVDWRSDNERRGLDDSLWPYGDDPERRTIIRRKED